MLAGHMQPSVQCARAVPGWGNSISCLWLLTRVPRDHSVSALFSPQGYKSGARSINTSTALPCLLGLLSTSSSTLGQKPLSAPSVVSQDFTQDLYSREKKKKERKKENKYPKENGWFFKGMDFYRKEEKMGMRNEGHQASLSQVSLTSLVS